MKYQVGIEKRYLLKIMSKGIEIPKFIINNRNQKSDFLFEDILKESFLEEICFNITGMKRYEVTYVDEVNYGRLAILKFDEEVNFITFSMTDYFQGRNSALQSAATALTRFYNSLHNQKKIYYYFLPHIGNAETAYLHFTYRLLLTSGVNFINNTDFLDNEIHPFVTVEDIILSRESMKSKNNNSTFIVKNSEGEIEMYAKTYGANKKEATIIGCALASVENNKVTIFQMIEGKLTQLPNPDRLMLERLGVKMVVSNQELEKQEFERDNSLRSPRFIFNILQTRGEKKCTLCECDIPQLIEGAHIWAVADIKKNRIMSQDEKIEAATDGLNGIWLCRNHHKLLDSNLIYINEDYHVKFNSDNEYISKMTSTFDLSQIIRTGREREYLKLRNTIFSNA